MENSKQHWENIYANKGDNEVSWYQEEPRTSIAIIDKYCKGKKEKSIIDVGGGNSMLADELIRRNYTNLCVLDISGKALDRSKERIPDSPIRWIENNILDCELMGSMEIWHDRAVFHFLTEKSDIEKYVKIVKQSIVKDGYLIIATFSENGPEKCSGLPITQYSEVKFRNLLEPEFSLEECFEETHKTPFETEQNFIWVVFKRK